MTELAEPLSVEEPGAGLLSRAVSVRLRLGWELTALVSLVVLGAGLRFWDLGSRALHHDESLHGYFAYRLFQGNGYQHDPLMHGPFQFFGMALTFFLTGGASDYTLRVLPALFGTILIVVPFFFRARLGTLGALFASALIALSPTLLYYSRFARNDIYIAVFTLSIVICLWRYVDERKDRYLFVAAALLGLSFATKENTYLHAAALIAFLDAWLAADFARQSRDVHKLDQLATYGAFVLYVPYAWALAALWPFSDGLRQRLGLRELIPAGDFLIIMGTLALPQFSAGLQVPLEGIFGVKIAPALEGATLGIPDGGMPIVLGLLAATAYLGLRWNFRAWAIAAACFYIPYALLYTSLLTHMDGFGSGIWGSLDYWLDQQDVHRGNQPFFYYLMLLPVYEFLPLVIAAPALFYYALKGDVFRRFLVFWPASAFLAYSLAGEKMPWLSVHTTLPVIILAAYVLGDVFSRLPQSHRLERVAPQMLPAAAACLGLAGMGFAAFGPSGGEWVTLRLLLALSAVGALLWLLRPYDNRRLAVGLAAAVIGGLGLFTVRAGIVATYEHGDVPREILIFTQTSPAVPDTLDRIKEAGRVSGLGEDVPVFVDSTYGWPWYWYLREYRNVSYGNVGAGFTLPNDAIVLLAVEHEAAMQPYLDRYQPPTRYPLRWWFPEFDTYKTLPTNSVSRFTDEFLESLFHGSTWSNWWSYWRDRETGFALGSADSLAYFPKAYPLPEAAGAPAPTSTPAQPLTPHPADAEGRLVLGQAGSQPGAFSGPSGLAVDSEGNIYVADTGNHRIQKFDKDGKFIQQAGGSGAGPGQFNQPGDIAIDADGNIYVADTWNHRIQKFDRDFNFLLAFGQPAGDLENPELNQVWGPRAVEVDSQGNILVADTGTNRVKKFSPDGKALAAYGARGKGEGQFVEPVGLAITAEGDILVADPGNARIQRFDAEFKFIEAYAVEQWGDGNPANKPYLTLLPDGRLLASDMPRGELLLLSADGSQVTEIKGFATASFAAPRGATADNAGFVYVTEPANAQVLRFPASDLPAP